MNRRQFLDKVFWGFAGLPLAGLGYTFLEAKWCRVIRRSVPLPNLPEAFAGYKLAFLSDIHHGPNVPLAYVRRVVAMTNALNADVICLGGDYVHRDRRYIAPCFEELRNLRAGDGVYGVLGNHDHWESAAETRAAMAQNGIADLTNTGVWLRRGGARLRLCGAGDLWEDAQDLAAALGDAAEGDAAVLLAHNPDYAEEISDRRVGLVLSGHCHGGQVVFPFVGAPLIPSRYGRKYLHGLVQAPAVKVFVTRGVGTISPPVRFRCRPEIALLTLRAGK
ncbi:MAG: metallophosphoesterase [Lentisphaerae bacterium]|nr:metallophosphoesterase [Lentisphaerota bacterium]